MSQVDMLSINAVAAKLGLSVHQLRRWELMFGLEIKRGRGQQRQYRSEDMSVLERIKELVEQGWPTSQIRPQLEAEGLVTPKLIGLPPPPGNPEVLMEALIGFRNFTERRFIEISRQIDELRQLMISITLKQELNGETSSPWQPMQREFAPEPKASPEQEFNIGPDYSAGPPVEFSPPPPPPQRQAIIPPVSATPPAESTFEVGPSSSSFGSSFASSAAPPERTKIIGEPTPPVQPPNAPFEDAKLSDGDDEENEDDFEDEEDFDDEEIEVAPVSDTASKAPADQAIAADFPPEKVPEPFPSFASAEKPATAAETSKLPAFMPSSPFAESAKANDFSSVDTTKPEPPSSLSSDFLLSPPQPSQRENEFNEFAPDNSAAASTLSTSASMANDMFSSVVKSAGDAARETAASEPASLPSISEIPPAPSAPSAPSAPLAPEAPALADSQSAPPEPSVPSSPVAQPSVSLPSTTAQPPLMPDLGSAALSATPPASEAELPSFLSNPASSPSSGLPSNPIGGSTFVPPSPTPQPSAAADSPFITPPQSSAASPFLTPPPTPYMAGGQTTQPSSAFEPPQSAQSAAAPAPMAPPPAPLPAPPAEAPKAAPAQVQKGPFLGEITDQNYLTILGRALDLVGWSDEQADNFSVERFKVPHWDELGRSQAEVLIEHLLTELQSQMGSEG